MGKAADLIAPVAGAGRPSARVWAVLSGGCRAAVVLSMLFIAGTCICITSWPEEDGLSTIRQENDSMRTMLRRSIIALIGSGLLATVYAMRPDVPVGSSPSRAQSPAAPARLPSTSTTPPVPTGPVRSAFDANATEPISSGLPKATKRVEGVKSPDADGPRAELAREPRSVGWGDSYAVRLLTPTGTPMRVAEIVLIAQMADGTVENVAMGTLLEPGIYRATVPTRRSTPISLQVRVKYGENAVRIPVRR